MDESWMDGGMLALMSVCRSKARGSGYETDTSRVCVDGGWIGIDQNGRHDDGLWDQGRDSRAGFSQTE